MADQLNAAQREALAAYKAYNVPGDWFIAEKPGVGGETEVVFLARSGDTIWSLLIAEDGDVSSSEATLTDFRTGIEV